MAGLLSAYTAAHHDGANRRAAGAIPLNHLFGGELAPTIPASAGDFFNLMRLATHSCPEAFRMKSRHACYRRRTVALFKNELEQCEWMNCIATAVYFQAVTVIFFASGYGQRFASPNCAAKRN